MPVLNRREFLQIAGGAAAAAALWPTSAEAAGRYGPFSIGMQSYSLRAYDLDTALKHTRELGLHYWEAFPDHLPESTDATGRQRILKLAAQNQVRVLQYGVVGFGGDAASNRRHFEFARSMGIQVISADPDPESFDQLDRLVEEFGIYIAIHNHGPGARYATIEDVASAIRGRHPRIGACVDTGHFLHSQVDPVEAVRVFGRRVYDVHLKDMKNHEEFTSLGRGDLNLVGLLQELNRLRFRHIMALEFEEHPENPMPDIQASLQAVREAVHRI